MECNTASIDCYFSNCEICPGIDERKEILEFGLQKHLIETVTFHHWVSVDRCNLETLKKSADEFVDIFCRDLKVLLRHYFIVKQQSAFMANTKENLSESEVAVVCDFSENYSFVLLDEAQSYHWNSSQATVHPFVVFFTEENTLQHYSSIISECLEHNNIAVHLFQQKLIDLLKFENRLKFFFIFQMAQLPSTKIKRTFQICAITKEILELMLDDIFQPLLTIKVCVIELWDC
ncbi:hypothetical protein AVEN_158878-1 [Araneus ventricosus]|uniref:Uncharacterized protein n=1 Tax=Araneus ventricosus TaxID=182803 RepID=A0A4Y2B944_ARAVE|nr:hypothetical protein AVEN_158878-1 [Araneus ventricosus]